MNTAHIMHGLISSFRDRNREDKNKLQLMALLSSSVRTSLIETSNLEVILSLLINEFEKLLFLNKHSFNITDYDIELLITSLNAAIIDTLVAVKRRTDV